MRKEAIARMLAQSRDVHVPIAVPEEEYAEWRIARKPAKKTRLVDDCETLSCWKPVTYRVSEAVGTDYGSMGNQDGLTVISCTEERAYAGSHSVRFTCPTNLEKLNKVAPGRIYAVPTAYRVVDRENWEEYNLLSAWVYPVAPGMKTITLRMQLHNDGEHKIPDIYDREGAHNVTLKANTWNQMVLEIPYLARDCVTGVGFEYDMVGHENDACDHVTFYIDQLELKEVDCDVYEGWTPKPDRLIYCHSGYQTGGEKVAFGAGLTAECFRILEMDTGRVLLERPLQTVETGLGTFQLMDFTDLMEEGTYLLTAGQAYSRAFQISNEVWESSIWKVLNFFLAERCGWDVLGKHRACHGDLLLKHDGKSIVANGGWHDAADVAQSLPNTAEGVCGLLALAGALEENPDHQRLYRRVLEEAKWGMDYLLKMRFGDGFRGTYSSSSIWTDGIIGTGDDITTAALDNAFDNFLCAYAEAMGARLFAGEDPIYAAWCLKVGREDYEFGLRRWRELDPQERIYRSGDQPFVNSDMIDPQICSAGALAAAELFARTGEADYREQAGIFAKRILSCQQQSFTDWDTPMLGFFYQDRKRDLIWHHYHLAYSYLPESALAALCRIFPASPDYMEWYSALVYSGYYYKKLQNYTAPYGMIPAGIYHEEEAKLGEKVQLYLESEPDAVRRYKEMVHSGSPLGKGYYVRRFPVWLSYRGNYNVMLSEAVAMNAGAVLRSDPDLGQAVQDQFAFILGKNPFGQSTMVGEGYDFVQHYAVQPGQSAGSLTVGMESLEANDAPYWPQVNTATYKEVWICPAARWVWAMADSFLPGLVYGCVKPGQGEISWTHRTTGKRYSAKPDPISGQYRMELPSGRYTMAYGGSSRPLTVVNHGKYRLDGELYRLTHRMEHRGRQVTIAIELAGRDSLTVQLRESGLLGLPEQVTPKAGKALHLSAEQTEEDRPFVVLLIPEGNMTDRQELLDERLLETKERRNGQ